MSKKRNAPYKIIAGEYYDPVFHPTCSNFREASKILIKKVFFNIPHNESYCILEVGAGKSVLIEICEELDLKFNKIVISDAEEQMLKYTLPFKLKNVEFSIIDAENTNIENSFFDIIISSLGDSYNTSKFWKEIRRTLKDGGYCLYTTPSYEWCKIFRKNQLNKNLASFITKTVDEVYIPSFIYDETTQVKMIKDAGLSCKQINEVKLRSLNDRIISPKLRTELADELPVVTSYLIRK